MDAAHRAFPLCPSHLADVFVRGDAFQRNRRSRLYRLCSPAEGHCLSGAHGNRAALIQFIQGILQNTSHRRVADALRHADCRLKRLPSFCGISASDSDGILDHLVQVLLLDVAQNFGIDLGYLSLIRGKRDEEVLRGKLLSSSQTWHMTGEPQLGNANPAWRPGDAETVNSKMNTV